MYFFPRTYICKKCSSEIQWSPSDYIHTPLIHPTMDGQIETAPICPHCWNKWLIETFGAMERKKE